jgi:hypothetical protein
VNFITDVENIKVTKYARMLVRKSISSGIKRRTRDMDLFGVRIVRIIGY